MPQLHLYVSDELAERLREKAKARRLPLSRYLSEVVAREVAPSWPAGFFEDVLGGWQGEPLERTPQGEPQARDPWAVDQP